jgi:hypothetical protein
MADSQTTSVTTAGPALFTYDGYVLYVFDGDPCMVQKDLGRRLGYAEDANISRLVEREWDDLKRFGLVRQPAEPKKHGGRGRGNVKDTTTNYFNERQVLWLTAKSEAKEAGNLLEELIVVYDAWRKGQLISRAEAAEARVSVISETAPAVPARQWPTQYSHAHSAFLTAGPPKSIPSGFIDVIRKDNRFTRFPTTLDITVTVTGDHVRVFDVDLGHAIGGECTNMVRPRSARSSPDCASWDPIPGTRSRLTSSSATATR